MNATEALAAAVRARLAQGSRQTGRIDMAALQTQVADGLANWILISGFSSMNFFEIVSITFLKKPGIG